MSIFFVDMPIFYLLLQSLTGKSSCLYTYSMLDCFSSGPKYVYSFCSKFPSTKIQPTGKQISSSSDT